jgi:hypothetical protein
MFTKKFNFNANLSYRFVNNSIERYTFINQTTGVNESTYENMGHNQNAGIFLYGRWNPVSFFNISLNGGMDYININNPERGLSNDGFSGRIFSNSQFMLPKDFSANLNVGYFSPFIQLQSKGSSFMFHGVTLNKNFMQQKLTVSVSAQNPFQEFREFKSTTDDVTFHLQSINRMNIREFRVHVSYRFGTLKDNIKKVRRGISNDDAKSGDSGQAGGTAVE